MKIVEIQSLKLKEMGDERTTRDEAQASHPYETNPFVSNTFHNRWQSNGGQIEMAMVVTIAKMRWIVVVMKRLKAVKVVFHLEREE